MRVRQLFLISACLLVACDGTSRNQSSTEILSKLDSLQQEVKLVTDVNMPAFDQLYQSQQHDNFYVMVDVDRNQPLAGLFSVRAISTGELVFLGEDIWSVEGVKVFTDSNDPSVVKNPLPNIFKSTYRMRYTELLMKFKSKSIERPPTNPPGS